MRSLPWSGLVLLSGTLGFLGLGLFGTPASADDAACKGLADAMIANTQTPYHSIGTISFDTSGGTAEAGGANMTKSLPTETIFTGTDVFVRLPSGKWQNVHASLDNLKERVRQTVGNFTDCQRLGDETTDGKSLAVYTGSSKNDKAVVTTKVWVAPDRGVLVRTETDMTGMPQADGEIRHQHLALRYDYSDIKPPTALTEGQ
jgi:hypothetical protein